MAATTDRTVSSEHHLARRNEAAFAARGDYPALLFEGRWHTSGELFERSRRLAGGLIAAGVGPGDRVVVSMANCPEVAIVYHAIWRAGGVVTPATFLLPPADLRHVVADSGAVAIVTTPEFLDKVAGAVAGLPELKAVITTGPAVPAAPTATAPDARSPVLALTELEQSAPAEIVDRADDELAALLYTGGTTGRSKGVMLTHANLDYTGRSAFESANVPGVNRALVTLPLSHSYGILVTLAGLHGEEPPVSVLLRWFDPNTFLGAIEEHRLEHTAVVPSMLQALLAQPLESRDLSSLRYAASGGAPLPPEVQAEFERRIPSVSIRQGYGLTETAALISTNPVGRERTGTVGLPVPGCVVAILDGAGRRLPVGEHGEICCRSPGVMRGYWNAPEVDAETLRGGWLHTGDIGYLDADGYLYVVDRIKDLIIRGGFNVYPRDVEDALVEHPDVAQAAVVGRPDTASGEEVVAFVSLRPDRRLAPDELIAWSREHIGGYRYPREVHVLEQIPLTPVGKIDRKAVRGLLSG